MTLLRLIVLKLALPSLLILSTIPSLQAEIIFKADFSEEKILQEWKFVENKWANEKFLDKNAIAPMEVAGAADSKIERPILQRFRPAPTSGNGLPLTLNFDFAISSNAKDGNRFEVSFYSDPGNKGVHYTALIRPGGICEIYTKLGGGVTEPLAKSADIVTIPEKTIMNGQYIWDESGYLTLKINNMVIAKTPKPVTPLGPPFSVGIWERYGKQLAANKVYFYNLSIENSPSHPKP